MNKRALRLDRVTPLVPLKVKLAKASSAEGGERQQQQPKPLSAFAASFSKQKSRFVAKSSIKTSKSKSDHAPESKKNEEWQGVKTKGKAKGVRGAKEASAAKPLAAATGGSVKGGGVEKRSVKRPSVANRKLKAKGLPTKPIPKPLKGSGSKGKGGGFGKRRDDRRSR